MTALLALIAGVPAHALTLECGPVRSHRLEAGAHAEFRTATAAILMLRESGADLEWKTENSDWRAMAVRPPRLGEVWIDLPAGGAVEVRSPSKQATELYVQSHCGPAPPVAACLRAIEAAASTKTPADVGAWTGDASCAAWAAHDRAYRLSLAGRADASHTAYAAAIAAWRRANDPRREAAALLGQAEESSSAGRALRALLESTYAEIANRRAGNAVFALRARNTQALSLRRLGREAEAGALYRSMLPKLSALGEWNDWALARYNLAIPALQAGDDAQVREHIAAVDAIEPALLTPVMRGRMAILRLLRASYGGDLLEALQQARVAEREFQTAALTSQIVYLARVQANLYRLLGLFPEAWEALARASTLAPPAESPQRTAGILLTYATIERDRGRLGLARFWANAAERLYRSLGFDRESRWMAAFQLGIDWRAGRDPKLWQASARALANGQAVAIACAPYAAALALDDRPAEGLAVLAAPRCRANELDVAIDQASARAIAMVRLGDVRGAVAHLLDFARAVDAALDDAGPALRYAVRRRLLELRDAWIVVDDRDPQAALDFALATHPGVSAAERGAARAGSASAAIGRALLGASESGDWSTAASRALIDSLASTGSRRPARPAVRIGDLQAVLAADEWLLLWLQGAHAGRALWIGAGEARVVTVAGRARLQQALTALHREIANPGAHADALAARASELSALLFAGSPTPAPPTRLWVLADEHLGTAPLALLNWPGQTAPLVDSSTTGWITVIDFADAETSSAPPTLHALVADQAGLENLPLAATEPELIVGALPGQHLNTHRAEAAGPEQLLAALRTPGALVHVAAHGMARTDRLGHSGLWLPPSAGATEPRFLSWLDIADVRLSASLVVLNACDLAAGPSALSQGSLSFAAAITNAGVAQVVAASWRTSDSASRVWVPAFYRALDPQRPETSAAALRAAQLALRDSPHFRHPWHWASLAHYSVLRVRPAAPGAGTAGPP
ncbi:MAG: CHAT domain-containing protein [Xanthomonadales bacterium PRO6]|nr:hypothetical protein [Xanthomonadales bacterium]MCE7930013.1 CHAT domain-containing protein [Xanthomonadales bacterium PRO6]